jgi:hypothetical protein
MHYGWKPDRLQLTRSCAHARHIPLYRLTTSFTAAIAQQSLRQKIAFLTNREQSYKEATSVNQQAAV